MECPTCKYPVPAEWSMCRRCGTPVRGETEVTRVTVPVTLPRRRSATAIATPQPPAPAPTAAASAIAATAAFGSAPRDTLLPGALSRPDNLLPRTARSKPALRPAHSRPARRPHAGARTPTTAIALARKHGRHVLVLVIVGAALTTSGIAMWPVAFPASPPSATSDAAAHARAISLLRTVVGGGRALFAAHHSFARVSPSALGARAHGTPIVASTTAAHAGEVSMRLTSATVLTLATPADADHCVFAIDEAEKSVTRFVTVRTTACRASAAPAPAGVSR